jgi:hypothetical protein
MGWAVGYDLNWQRDVGYGVPSICDRPDCGKKIDRGLGYVCGGQPYGGENGCGLFFCTSDLVWDDDLEAQVCARCIADGEPFTPTPDVEEWTRHKATDPSWAAWRAENGIAEPGASDQKIDH